MTIASRIQTHRQEVTSTSIPIVGKIKTGYKHPAKNHPVSTDYFIADSKYAAKFHDHYGEKPNTITIAFYNENVEEMCREFFELRDKDGRLRAYGDGEKFKVWSRKNNKDGEYITLTTTDYPDLMETMLQQDGCQESKWTQNLEMHFLIPAVRSVYGCWRYRSRGGMSTIPHIIKTFDTIREHAGRIAFIPFDLHVQFVKSQKPGAQSRFPVVSLIPNISQEHVAQLAGYTGDLTTGLLTEEKIEQMTKAVKQLPHQEEPEKEIVIETAQQSIWNSK